MVQRWKDILAIVPFGRHLAHPVYNLPWRRPWNQAKGGRCYPSYVMHHASRQADVDNNSQKLAAKTNTSLCCSNCVTNPIGTSYLGLARLPWLAPTLWLLCVQRYGPRLYPIKKRWHITEQVYFYPYLSYLYIMSHESYVLELLT